MRRWIALLLVLSVLSLAATTRPRPAETTASAQADIIELQPGDSIQDALDRAEPGQTVRLAPGTYREGPGQTLCFGPGDRLLGSGRGETYYYYTPYQDLGPYPQSAAVLGADDATIEGLTIYGWSFGLVLDGARGMTVRDVETHAGHSALWLLANSEGNLIEGNIVSAGPLGYASLRVTSSHGNTFRNNQFLGQTKISTSSGNAFAGDLFRGGPLEESPNEALVLNESSDNRFGHATFYARYWRTIRVWRDEGGNVVSNSIIAGGEEDAARIGVEEGSSPLLEWTLVDRKIFDVFDAQLALGEGVITADPRFADPDNDDFRPMPDSPAIDAGDPAGDPDPDGTRADLGAIPFDQARLQLLIRGDREVTAGDTLVLKVGAFDPQGDPLTFTIEESLPEDVQFVPLGDVSLDGSLRSVDGALILQHEAGLFDLEAHGIQTAVADMNADGTVNAIDASLVWQWEAGRLPPQTEYRLLWTPTPEQLGSHELTFIVSDGTHTASETIQILVDPAGTGPPHGAGDGP